MPSADVTAGHPAPSRLPAWLLVFGLAFFGYYSLLIFADLTRPEPLGLTLQIQQSGLGVRAVDADSPAARAGLAPGDRIVSANSHPTKSRLDWISVEMNLRTGAPVRLEIDGGVKADNIGQIAKAGADTFVAGSAIFGEQDYRAVIGAMRRNIDSALTLRA